MNLLQEHPRAATAGAILIGVAVIALLYALSEINKAPVTTTTATGTVTEERGEAGSTASSEQYGDAQGDTSVPVVNGDYSEFLAVTTVQAQEATLDYDVDSDGMVEVLVLVRSEGEARLLDWYLIDNDSGEPVMLFERRGVVRGEVTVDGPRIIEAEAVFAPGDEDCCPSQSKRTFYVWKDGSLVESRVEAAPAGAPAP
jgi:hypothetical protein